MVYLVLIFIIFFIAGYSTANIYIRCQRKKKNSKVGN